MGFGKDGKGVIIRESCGQALGGLGTASSIFIGTKLVTEERFRMLKQELWSSIVGLTAGDGDGLLIGLADGDLSLSEIDAAIENNGPLGPNDSVSAAISMRAVWLLGHGDPDGSTELTFINETGGAKMTSTPRWTFAKTKSWNLFVYNLGATITTGATVNIRAKDFGVWVT